MATLRIRLFGGLEVWHGDQPITGFESQKVRVLLAYLLLNRDTAHSRDRLAGLLWPEKDDDTARRNLRQALYNLRTALPHGDASPPPILTTHQSVQFNPETDYWLDVEAFEDGVRRGMSGQGSTDPHHLAGAVQLYRGDLLAGFFVQDSPALEHWLLYEQERLREMAIQALRRLVDWYLVRKEYRLGIQYARRLLEIDPLFEEAHRKLMRLYALSGRRSRALVQYEACRELLRTELGVEPLEETTALYRTILAEEWPLKPVPGEEEPTSPPVPFVGRDAAYARLRRSWEAVQQGKGRLTLVEGETGIGKTRLVEEVIRHAVTQARATVLRGQCYELVPWLAYQPVAEALRRTVTHQVRLVQQALAGASPLWLADVARIVPELYALGPDLPEPPPLPENGAHQQLFEAVARFLEVLAQARDSRQLMGSLILFLDDLHWADRSGLELLQYLARRLAEAPIWIVAAYRPEGMEPAHPLLSWQQQLSRHRHVDRVVLERLNPPAIEQIATALVGGQGAGEVARFLDRESAGLPLTITELIHYLVDAGLLVASEGGRWTLVGPLPTLAAPTPENLHDLILWRVSQLPTSARRLLTLASVIGPRFDADLLRETDGEHLAVVEASIDIWLERRLVRHVSMQPTAASQEASTGPHVSATRWGTFEFAHDEIRLAIYHDVNPQRRKVMHHQVAVALEKRYAGDTARVCEALAHHYTAARRWDKAVIYLQQAGDRARQARADDTALSYYDRALEALDRLERAARGEGERERWLEQRFQVLASRADLYGTLGARDRQEADLLSLKETAEQLNEPHRVATTASLSHS